MKSTPKRAVRRATTAPFYRQLDRLLLSHAYQLQHGLVTLKSLSMQKGATGHSAAFLGKRAARLGIEVHRGRPAADPLAALQADLSLIRRVSLRLDRGLDRLKARRTPTSHR